MAKHYLKTWKAPFEALLNGRKHFEWRYNDRGFCVGDILFLKEIDETTNMFTNRQLKATVSYLLSGPAFGIPANYCIMSLTDIISCSFDE